MGLQGFYRFGRTIDANNYRIFTSSAHFPCELDLIVRSAPLIPIGQTHAVQTPLGSRSLDDFQAVTQDAKLRELSQKLEATFLAEMLKYAGVGESKSEFSGGVGEDQFASFLRQAQAEEITKSGGIGLAETLFKALKEPQNGTI